MPSFWENLRFPGEREMDDMHGAEGQDMTTYVSSPNPSTGNSFPAVIVIMEAFGVTSHIEKVCDQYAANGYVAIAPALYHRQHPNPKLGYDEMPAVQQYMGALRDDELIEDVNVAIRYLQVDNQRTAGNKIGIVGYCVGGRISYLAATSCPGLSAASVYYGGRILVPFGDGLAPIDLTGNIKIPVMGNFGDTDENPSPADVATIDAKLKAAGATYDFKSYPGAGHGFNCDDRGSYNEAAAKDAFTRTLGWFNKYVK
ncbi:MAG: dienelactone hydrolase family protein [SAR202 cluster bacterium]|nr:dienelactone hydrolase family protein [SAR202 cluster bacterium]